MTKRTKKRMKKRTRRMTTMTTMTTTTMTMIKSYVDDALKQTNPPEKKLPTSTILLPFGVLLVMRRSSKKWKSIMPNHDVVPKEIVKEERHVCTNKECQKH